MAYFVCYGVLFDVMAYFLTLWRTFLCFGLYFYVFYVMAYVLMFWRTFVCIVFHTLNSKTHCCISSKLCRYVHHDCLKFENFGDIMFLVASPPPHANACTGHNFVTNTPIKFIFAIAIEIPDYKNPIIF